MPKKIPIRPFIIAAIVLSVSVYFIRICLDGLDQSYLENDWKVASGTVLDPQLKLSDRKSIARKNEGIEQAINYEYAVNGRVYRTNSVSPEAFVNASDYPQGKAIDVYYDPNDPANSVLIRIPVQTQYLWGMILACLAVIIVTIISLIRDIKNAD